MTNLRVPFLVAFLLSGFFLSAQIQQPNVNLKFGKGLRITAADSSMYLKVGFRMQSLYQSSRVMEDGTEWESSFLVRRSRLKFDGWAVSPKLTYKVELALSNKDLKSSSDFEETSEAPKIILDAVLKWKVHKNLEIWAGQTKLPGNRERVVSSQKLQFVDRSLVNSVFNLDRDMGIQLRSKFKMGNLIVKPTVAWAAGEGRNVTINNVGGSSFTGRLEILPLGEFSSKGDYFESDLKREQKPKVAFGASYNYNNGTARQKQTGRFLVDSLGNYLLHDIKTIFVDAIFKYKGFSVFGEYAHKSFANTNKGDEGFPPSDAIDAKGRSYYTGNGLTLQASYLFKSNWEVASRFTKITPDHAYSFKELNEYTFGLSKYIVGHNLKVQGDVSLTDIAAADNNNLRYRLQFEFAF